MKRETSILAVLAFLSAFALPGFSQGVQSQPVPPTPSNILGPKLIAWSQMQAPQPVAQPLSAPALQSSGSAQQSPNPPAQPQPEAQTFTGTVIKNGDRYVLQVSATVYELDDQKRAEPYDGKQVKVTGNLDAKGNIVHVVGIELLS